VRMLCRWEDTCLADIAIHVKGLQYVVVRMTGGPSDIDRVVCLANVECQMSMETLYFLESLLECKELSNIASALAKTALLPHTWFFESPPEKVE